MAETNYAGWRTTQWLYIKVSDGSYRELSILPLHGTIHRTMERLFNRFLRQWSYPSFREGA